LVGATAAVLTSPPELSHEFFRAWQRGDLLPADVKKPPPAPTKRRSMVAGLVIRMGTLADFADGVRIGDLEHP
jgi:hypothetical protein